MLPVRVFVAQKGPLFASGSSLPITRRRVALKGPLSARLGCQQRVVVVRPGSNVETIPSRRGKEIGCTRLRGKQRRLGRLS